MNCLDTPEIHWRKRKNKYTDGMEDKGREWTAEEVALHNTKDDCYVIVHGTNKYNSNKYNSINPFFSYNL